VTPFHRGSSRPSGASSYYLAPQRLLDFQRIQVDPHTLFETLLHFGVRRTMSSTDQPYQALTEPTEILPGCRQRRVALSASRTATLKAC
jgi:hypothetical protein